MRENKLRAWDKDEKEMIYGINKCLMNWDGLQHNVDRFLNMPSHIPVMWYTSLKDKNKKEIYEGDIVKHNQEPTETNHIEYYDAQYHLEPHGLRLCDEYESIEIIGNIYENPELLETK